MTSRRFDCRRAAVLADIHSNIHAFRACYEDAKAMGADLFVLLGDYVSDLADPEACLDLVQDIRSNHPAICLRGNRERYMLDCAAGQTAFAPGSHTGSLLFTFQRLRPKDLAFLESLPIQERVTINGVDMETAHAGRTDDRFLFFGGQDENTAAAFEQMDTRWLICGHSHRQFLCRRGGKTILNPGSVGMPHDFPCLTQYALLTFDAGAPHFTLRRLPYDLPAVIRRQFESDLMRLAPHWAMGALCEIITGREVLLALLGHIRRAGHDLSREESWRKAAVELALPLTQQEMLALYEKQKPNAGD